MIVGAPVDDALLDGFGFEVLGEGFADEGGELGVGGEAEGDELGDGELVDVGAVLGGEQRGEAETLFEADDAVLHLEGAAAAMPAMTKKTTARRRSTRDAMWG